MCSSKLPLQEELDDKQTTTQQQNEYNLHNSSYVKDCLESMKADGARLTKTRKAVLSCLASTHKPLTPADIIETINRDETSGKKIDLVSVYRILKYMSDLNLVHQLGPDGGYFPCAHSNCTGKVHVLLNCSNCHDTTELHVPQSISSSLTEFLKNKINFTANTHSFELRGTCDKCTEVAP